MKLGWGPRLATTIVAIAITTAAVFLGAAVADSRASISVSFSDDAKSATINSSKGISHYTVTLCSGGLDKVEPGGEILSLGVGPFDSPITSIEVKAGTTDQTFSSGASCDEPPVDENPPSPPVDEHPPAPPVDENPPAPPVDEHPPAPPVDEHPPAPPVDEHPPAPPVDEHPPAPPVDEHPPAPPVDHHPAPPEEHPLPPVTDTPPTTDSTPSTPDPTPPTPPAPSATPTPPAPQAPFTPPAAPRKHKVKGVYQGCYTLRVSTREVTVGKRTELRVVVLRGRTPAAGIVVKLHGAGVLVTAKTDKHGVAHFAIRAARAGILTVSLSGPRNCATARIGAVGAFTPPVTG